MGMMGLAWDTTFLKTRAGMTMTVESGVGLLGAVISIVLGNGLESFIYCSTFFISGFFLFTNVTNLTKTLEAKGPSLPKIHLGYLVIWTLMLAIACIYRFFIWNLISIFSWVLLFAFLIDLFFKYRSSPSSSAGLGPATPAAAEAGNSYGTV
eukprot:GFUD01037072.1.p1 GENE.GFUD01037072.1~~GFUD01037072.1.p1  ORF type:complete len:172 (-),score=26.71 GFUD01037072.1:106-561(-)